MRIGSAMKVAIAALLALGSVAPAGAEICDVKFYDSHLGKITGDADRRWQRGDQFILCFTPTSDGFASLWDRIPSNAPVERLVPNANYRGVGEKAALVAGGQETCFGTGKDGYYLVMDPADGDGFGLMFLIFQEKEDLHPTEASFDTGRRFASRYEALGAGTIAVGPEAAQEHDAQTAAPEGAARSCPNGQRPRKSFNYSYRVE
ncbi:MAG: hypothetical protein MRY63_11710 [Neomegalonema sp.]|nr:hypothetical protein [Neomegalonema sp.]